jgi:hypothetical protein
MYRKKYIKRDSLSRHKFPSKGFAPVNTELLSRYVQKYVSAFKERGHEDYLMLFE